ncbi:MAG TPA: Xaa-Pro aminopeptidase, partial [Spirochaetota bacterium]|nr:Xaa-Pro aminopeptidase [Spirochaetota bacterium]
MNKKNYNLVFFNDGLKHGQAVKRYRQRRQRLARSCKVPVVISSVQCSVNRNDSWLNLEAKFYQEPLLLYLTGINQPQVLLLLDSSNREQPEILFVPPRDKKKEFWTGYCLSLSTENDKKPVTEITGIKEVRPLKEFNAVIKKIITTRANRELATLWHESDKGEIVNDSNAAMKKKLTAIYKKSKMDPDRYLINIAGKQFRQRTVLDQRDIINAQQANKIAAFSFKNLCRKLKHLRYEYEAAGFLDGQIRYRTPFGQSFPTIAAGGSNACVLHYEANNSRLRDNELLLLDFGARCYAMPSDISRTVPVSGSFDPLQRILYKIVLQTQTVIEKKVGPGISIARLNKLCWDFINKEIREKITARGGQAELSYSDQPHGVSHLIGIAVHDGDPFGNYKKYKLRPGQLISNEPGLYGKFSLNINS